MFLAPVLEMMIDIDELVFIDENRQKNLNLYLNKMCK